MPLCPVTVEVFIFLYDQPWQLLLRLFQAVQVLLEPDVRISLSAPRLQSQRLAEPRISEIPLQVFQFWGGLAGPGLCVGAASGGCGDGASGK